MTTTYRVLEQSTSPWQQQVKALQNNVPVGPAGGDRYIVTATASGAWAGKETNITYWDGAAWQFDVPAEGWEAYNDGDHLLYTFNGTSWINHDISGKADKVSGSPNGFLAGLDGSGNLTNSAILETSVNTAITEAHIQNTDTILDNGGANMITAAQAKEAYTREAQYDGVLKVLKFTI